jgi:hypothetical protein
VTWSPDGRPGTADLQAGGWLTTVLRPAGTLDRPALDRLSQALARLAASSDMVIVDRLSQALARLAASSDMVIVDLTATQVAAPRARQELAGLLDRASTPTTRRAAPCGRRDANVAAYGGHAPS